MPVPRSDRAGCLVSAAGITQNPQHNLPTAPEWLRDGLCSEVDDEIFFPEKGGSTRAAKSVCCECPVREQCLNYALDNNERYGIWGGYSERERRALKKRRAA